jgi:hypothetical protein
MLTDSLRIWCLVCFLCGPLCGPLMAAERLRVDPGNVLEIEIGDCLKAAERAANDEDLDGYTSCFCFRLRKPMRSRIGLLFVQHDIGLEIVDSHVLKKTETAGEIAVKYRASLSANTAEIVSVLALSKEDGAWKIGKEKIQTSRIRHDGRSSSQGSGGEKVQFNFGGAGAVILNQNDPLLPKDIGQRPGGCANGRCGL